MPAPHVFIDLENRFIATLSGFTRPAVRKMAHAVSTYLGNDDYASAQDVANRFDLKDVLDKARPVLEQIALQSIIFGAHNCAGSVNATTFVQQKIIPIQLHQALDQLVHMIEQGASQTIRDTAHVAIRGRQLRTQKADDDDLVEGSIMGTGNRAVDLAANLTTSRLVSLGYLYEATFQAITVYEVTEELDGLTCGVCATMHGTQFSVATEYSRLIQVLGTSDPDELAALAPWPTASGVGAEQIKTMTGEELQAAGFGSPPYHPSCRGMLTNAGTTVSAV